MKMKKYMAVALAATLLTLAGCGNTNDSSSVSDEPASTKAATESAETTTTTVESTTTAEATEPDESAVDSMAFAEMANVIDKAMSAHMNDPADTADDMLKLCRATIEDLKANGLPLGEYTGEVGELDENGESYGEHNIGDLSYTSALVCKMPASTLSVSDIEGITLESADSFRMRSTDPDGKPFDSYSVGLRFDIGGPKNPKVARKACENIFSYFIGKGYTDTEKDFTPIQTAREYVRGAYVGTIYGDVCRVQVKNDKFEIMITPDEENGICDISFNKL